MKLKNWLLFLLLGIQYASTAQVVARADSFVFRSDTVLSYRLNLIRNDSSGNKSKLKIISVNKLGSNFATFDLEIPSIDSQLVIITSTLSNTTSGLFSYRVSDTAGNIDSALVSFKRQILPLDMYPGDVNRDNLVNHLDLLPIGLMYGTMGEIRHDFERNTLFTPKRVANWIFSKNNLNAKYADIDGNGIVDSIDVDELAKNLGNSRGIYAPILSDSNSLRTIQVSVQDTIYMTAQDSGKLKLPIKLNSPITSSSYGIGYSLSVENQNKTNAIDTFYHNYKFQNLSTISPVWIGDPNSNLLVIEDRVSRNNHTNIAFCKRTGLNGDNTGDLGIVEIIVDDILLGITKQEEHGRLRISIKDIALIDKDYNFLPIKPESKYIYIKKNIASIANVTTSKINVYPTLIDTRFVVEKNQSHSVEYKIYNSLGQVVKFDTIKDPKTVIDCGVWARGIYYLRLDNSQETVKLIKR